MRLGQICCLRLAHPFIQKDVEPFYCSSCSLIISPLVHWASGEMCKYIESTHTYELCKLQDENQDGSPNPLAGFFSRITSALSNAPGEDVAPMANRRDLHVVKEKMIIQCIAVRKDPNQQGRHVDERRCADPTPLNASPVTIGETEHRGICPVCQAGEEAITGALSRDIIFPVDRGCEPRSRSRGDVNGRGIENVHHGHPRPRRRHRSQSDCGCM